MESSRTFPINGAYNWFKMHCHLYSYFILMELQRNAPDKLTVFFYRMHCTRVAETFITIFLIEPETQWNLWHTEEIADTIVQEFDFKNMYIRLHCTSLEKNYFSLDFGSNLNYCWNIIYLKTIIFHERLLIKMNCPFKIALMRCHIPTSQ
jgi:hypothetical protein